MADGITVKSQGIGFFGLLGIVFIVLKLCKVITWNWWFVLMPLYGPLVALAIFIVTMIVFLGIAMVQHHRERNR